MYKHVLPLVVLASAAYCQAPAFEVASVKRSEPITPAMVQSGRVKIGVSIDALHVHMSQYSLFDLTMLAYQVKPHQVSGPAWMPTERYDIQAKLPDGGRRAQVPAMLQTLLAERFGMRIHRETRDFDVYALVVDKGGPRLKPSSTEASSTQAPGAAIGGGIAVSAGGSATSVSPTGDSRVTPGPGGNLHIECTRMTMIGLANLVNRYRDRPVFDQTGIAGAYDLELDISGEEVRDAARAHGAVIPPPTDAAAEAAPDPGGVSLNSSLRKLGLKLLPRKAAAEVIVIDKVEKVPTEN